MGGRPLYALVSLGVSADTSLSFLDEVYEGIDVTAGRWGMAVVGGNVTTTAGLRVKAKLDKRKYAKGITISKAQMDELSLHRDQFHGDWNYELRPR